MTALLNALTDEQTQDIERLRAALDPVSAEMQGDRILDTLGDWLLDDEQKLFLSLNTWDLFFLCASAFVFETPDETGLLPATDRIDKKKHLHGIADKDQARIIARICSLIRTDPAGLNLSDDPGTRMYKGAAINTSLLAGAIRLASQLDLSHPPAAQAIAQAPAVGNPVDGKRFCQYFTVMSTGPHPFLPGTIRARIRCRNPEVHRALKHHENFVQNMLHVTNMTVSPRFLFSDVIFEIEPEGYTPLDMKFAVDSMAALHLLTGNRLYSDRRVFLRELVQNAVDACNLKKLFDSTHTPEISIEFDDQTRMITFRDNGIGMDRQWIEKYFLKIGISFYQFGDLKNINQHRVDVNFISKFGIGFLSSFMVAEKIVIRTRKNASPGLLITITHLQEYFDVRFAPKDCPAGTEVTLYLKDSGMNYSRAMEFICYLKTNLRFLTVPVKLTDHEGRTTILGHEKLKYHRDDYKKCEHVARLRFRDAEGYLFLKAKRNLDTLYALEAAKGGISIFQDGIFVTQTDSLLPEGARQNVIGRINLTGTDRCELSMDRNRIFWTDAQHHHIKRTVRLGLVDIANQLLIDTGKLNPPLAVEQSMINHLSIFFDFNEVDDEMYQHLPGPVKEIVAKRFRDFVRIHFAHTQQNRHVPEADGYAEKWQQTILASFSKRSRPPVSAG